MQTQKSAMYMYLILMFFYRQANKWLRKLSSDVKFDLH